MKLAELEKYRPLYTHARLMGASTILNRFLGLGERDVVPLSIAHGVDFGHCNGAMDVQSPAPVHWAYNNWILEDASRTKPTVLLPHPWLMIASSATVPSGTGTLVVGPPPGRENDATLLRLLGPYRADDLRILIKGRGPIAKSIRFWESNGIRTVSAGPSDDGFYPRLFETLSGVERVVGCTFSSALIFAASLGKAVEFVRGYTTRHYDSARYLDIVRFDSPRAQSVVKTFLSGTHDSVTRLARQLLGADIREPRDVLHRRYLDAIDAIEEPLYLRNRPGPLRRAILTELARRSGKPGAVDISFDLLKSRLMSQAVSIIRMDDVAIWSEGINNSNFHAERTRYIKGVTEPGTAYVKYD